MAAVAIRSGSQPVEGLRLSFLPLILCKSAFEMNLEVSKASRAPVGPGALLKGLVGGTALDS